LMNRHKPNCMPMPTQPFGPCLSDLAFNVPHKRFN
jgi:hypothetical protein